MVNSFLPCLRLTVKNFQFLRLSTKVLAVLRLSVNPIETLLQTHRHQAFSVVSYAAVFVSIFTQREGKELRRRLRQAKSQSLVSPTLDLLQITSSVACSQLVTEYQWAYGKGQPTDLLLALLTQTWRRALDSNLVVGVLFIDFQEAFDSISQKILIHKPKHNYGIKGNLLDWVRDYLSERNQYTVVNGELSDQAYVASGVPQGSVLGPTLFALYTGDLPEAVSSASLYM